MRTILLLFVALLFVAGCGSGGESTGGESTDTGQVDCSDPALTRTEPLPFGTHPEAWITTGNNYWDCGNGSKQYYHDDGTLTGSPTDTEEYDLLLTIQKACGADTRHLLAGDWVVADDTICIRLDIIPGIVFCAEISSEPDGSSYTVEGDTCVIQYGQEVSCNYQEPVTCSLQEE